MQKEYFNDKFNIEMKADHFTFLWKIKYFPSFFFSTINKRKIMSIEMPTE